MCIPTHQSYCIRASANFMVLRTNMNLKICQKLDSLDLRAALKAILIIRHNNSYFILSFVFHENFI